MKRKHNPTPEAEHFCSPGGEGEQGLKEFLKRYNGGRISRRGNHYNTERDYSFRSAETRTYHDRMVES